MIFTFAVGHITAHYNDESRIPFSPSHFLIFFPPWEASLLIVCPSLTRHVHHALNTITPGCLPHLREFPPLYELGVWGDGSIFEKSCAGAGAATFQKEKNFFLCKPRFPFFISSEFPNGETNQRICSPARTGPTGPPLRVEFAENVFFFEPTSQFPLRAKPSPKF